MLDLITWLDEDILNEMTPFFLKNSPNTYAYSKCLSEQLVCSFSTKVPLVIARPSIGKILFFDARTISTEFYFVFLSGKRMERTKTWLGR